MEEQMLRVMIIDDSIAFRKMLRTAMESIPGVMVAGMAYNGEEALEKFSAVKPHVVTLDMEMPEMDGLETFRRLKALEPRLMIIIISSCEGDSAKTAMEAFQLGALDVITKPREATLEDSAAALTERLKGLLKGISSQVSIRTTLGRRPAVLSAAGQEVLVRSRSAARSSRVPAGYGRDMKRQKADVVAIGISTGGPVALSAIIPGLPADLGIPVLVVQHMPPSFTPFLARQLDGASALKVVEGSDGEPLMANTVYIAPGGKHMGVRQSPVKVRPEIQISNDPPINFCRPSVDYLFQSLAPVYGSRVLAVIMTGMGNDGVKGLEVLKSVNARVIAQDEASSTVFGMAREAISATLVDTILPLDEIAGEIIRQSRGDRM